MHPRLPLQGKLQSALPAYQQASRLWEGQPVVWFSIARIHHAQGQLSDALEAVEHAMELHARGASQGLSETLEGFRAQIISQLQGSKGP